MDKFVSKIGTEVIIFKAAITLYGQSTVYTNFKNTNDTLHCTRILMGGKDVTFCITSFLKT